MSYTIHNGNILMNGCFVQGSCYAEIIARYLIHAYTENKVNYDIYSSSNMGEVWESIADKTSRKLVFDIEKLRRKTRIFWKISKNIDAIIRYPELTIDDEEIKIIANTVYVFYQ